MYNINNHIKNKTYKHIYLICGPERYLVRQFRNKLKTALMEGSDEMNLLVADDSKNVVDEVIDFADTLPFFGERRLVIIDDGDAFLKNKDIEKFNRFIAKIPDTSYIIIICGDEEPKGKVPAFIKKEGYLSNMQGVSDRDLRWWINSTLKNSGKKIEIDALNYLIDNVGTSMDLLSCELQKLIAYTGERDSIDYHDVRAITTKTLSSKVYDITKAIQKRDSKSALRIYNELIAEKNPAVLILGIIRNNINELYLVKQMSDNGTPMEDMTINISKNSKVISLLMKICKDFTTEELYHMLETCQSVEYDIKTGAIDQGVGVETMIIQFCEKEGNKR